MVLKEIKLDIIEKNDDLMFYFSSVEGKRLLQRESLMLDMFSTIMEMTDVLKSEIDLSELDNHKMLVITAKFKKI